MTPSFEHAREAVRARLSAAGAEHSEQVADAAASLAARYGGDPDQARLAGVLHDWHRETDPATLVARAREVGIEITQVDETAPHLLHAPVAAADLATVFPGIDEAVLAAVGAHTYGAPVMSALAKIVYIADMIEPGRTYGRVAELRRLAGEIPLDELFARAYSVSVRHVISKRRPLHPTTIAVYNAHVAQVRA